MVGRVTLEIKRLGRALHCCFAIVSMLALLAPQASYAADIDWLIGPPSAAEMIGQNVQEALGQFGEMSQHMAQLEAGIEDSRRAFFSASPSGRKAAGNKFARILLQKDLMMAMPRVMMDGQQAQLLFNLMKLSHGNRLLDGGIPANAWDAFNNWVSALRTSAGPSWAGMAPNPVLAARAMTNGTSIKEYEVYRRLRDQAEWDEFNASRNDGTRRLVGAGEDMEPLFYFGVQIGEPPAERLLLSKSTVLRCTYGGRTSQWHRFYFWRNRAPDDVGELMGLKLRGMDALLDHAADTCPADSKQAGALASLPAKVAAVPPKVRESTPVQASAPPGDLESTKASREVAERRDAARKVQQDRQAQQQARQAAFQACNEDRRAMVMAAQLARDRYAMTAAHEKYIACTNAARSR